jgi:copper resistance protein B
MRARILGAALALAPAAAPAQEILLWGIQVEQFEYRFGGGEEAIAWDADAFVGSDELKLVFRTEGEYATGPGAFEAFESQVRLQRPVSEFFDAVVGVRLDMPEGGPGRVHGVVGLKGLAPQWFEVDADFYLSEYPSFRFEAEYEALITNRITLVPSVEIDLPLRDDPGLGLGGFGPKVEIGLRLGYDLVDRAVTPYVGIQYERVFGETAAIARRNGEARDSFSALVGLRIVY